MRKERLSWTSTSSSTASRSDSRFVSESRSSANSGSGSVDGGIGRRAIQSQFSEQAQTTLIASGCGIKGELFFSGVSQLDCRVEGEIASEGELILGERAQVRANINAQSLVVFGALEGDVICSERVELHAGARVRGTICSPRIVMHDGVHFEGDCSMPRQHAEREEFQESDTDESDRQANE